MNNKVIRIGVIIAGIFFGNGNMTVFGGEEQSAKDLPALIRQLHEKDPDLRCDAAEQLGKLGDAAKDAIPDLIESLGDEGAR